MYVNRIFALGFFSLVKLMDPTKTSLFNKLHLLEMANGQSLMMSSFLSCSFSMREIRHNFAIFSLLLQPADSVI